MAAENYEWNLTAGDKCMAASSLGRGARLSVASVVGVDAATKRDLPPWTSGLRESPSDTIVLWRVHLFMKPLACNLVR